MNNDSPHTPETFEEPAFPRRSTFDLADQKTWVDTLAWYLLVMGFSCILVGGLFFWLYGQGKLRYADYILNGHALGRYFLFAGIFSYLIGRILTYVRRLHRNRKADKMET